VSDISRAAACNVSDALRALRAACFGRDLDREGWPSVSVVVPVRNEGPHLERAVTSILGQDYPIPFDVCLAVAPSNDDTAAVAARLVAGDERISVVENPQGVTPAGLNAAIAGTAGSVVVRVDGHAELSTGYIRRAVETMCRTGAANVGGTQVPKPETPFEEAVAAATTSWMGTGGATYRVGGEEGAVDTVYLGVFDRAAGDTVGWFDETLIRNQDYELNIRLRQAGATVWFDPELSVGYRPRGSWRALARQYYEYGYWKAEVLRRHPTSARMRQLVASLTPLVAASCMLAAPFRRRALIVPAGYGVTTLVAAWPVRTSRPMVPIVALVFITQHTAWACGFWFSALTRRSSIGRMER
jgi:cellulose synthase/poly-beta-1,6-N-acetylglucosamine synthase-like glycosyltransferase